MRSEAESITRLGQSLRKRGIYAVATDGDDMLWQTDWLFKRQQARYKRAVTDSLPDMDPVAFGEEFETLNHEFHKSLGVRSSRWFNVTDELGLRHTARERQVITDPKNVDILMDIYRTSPPLIPYAHTMLRMLSLTGLPVILVTFANAPWTHIKVRATRIGKYLYDSVIVDEHKAAKTAADWRYAAAKAHTAPRNMMGMGDNLDHDILAGVEAGYGALIYKPSAWGKLISNGSRPPGVVQIQEVRGIIPELTSPANV